MAKKIIKRKLKDHEFLNLYKQGFCIRCFKRQRDQEMVCDSCHTLLQQVAKGATPKPYTFEELEQIMERLEELWPDA